MSEYAKDMYKVFPFYSTEGGYFRRSNKTCFVKTKRLKRRLK